MAAAMTDVVVRRRGGLMATIAGIATVVAVAYLWSFSRTGNAVELAIGALVGAIAVAHAVAWRDARTPLLVADETGVRIRLGSAWTGVPWTGVEQVEVQDRGRIRDGHVAVLLPDGSQALAGAGLRSRFAAWVNHMFFEAPLVAPFGLSTTVSVVDVAGALGRLAAGRTPVLMVDSVDESGEATVEIVRPARREPDTALDSADAGSTVDTDQPNPSPAAPAWKPARWPLFGSRSNRPATDPAVTQWADTSASTTASATASAAGPVSSPMPSSRPLVSNLESRAARRDEISVATSSVHATDGGLALSPVADDAEPAIALPEIEQLRRPSEPNGPTAPPDHGLSNVSLIIDATTDLSARAMQRARKQTTSGSEPEVRLIRDNDEPPGELIGHELATARTRLGMSVDELAERTRIRPYVIESIEVDDFGPCGGDFYARGHLRQLSRVLGLNPVPLIETYDEHVATSPITPREVFEVELAAGTTGMVRGGERGANWGALIAAVLVLLIIWGVARYFTDDPAKTDANQTPTNNSGVQSPGPGNPPVAAPVDAKVRLTAEGGESRVVVTDRFKNTLFAGVLTDGMSKRVSGESPLRVLAVDGGVIELKAKGKERGLMGEPGERVHTFVRGKQ